jgi:spore coat-associated protein N
MTANSRKALVPLATLLAAGAVAIGSGATWTSTTSSSVSVTSGDVLHTNNHDGAVLTVANIKPGDTVSGTVDIENTGTLDATLGFQESGDTTGFSAGGLNLVIKQGSTELYNGDFGGYANTVHNLGDLDSGETSTFTFTISMPSDASNANQNKTASATYTWVTTQKDAGTTLVENWL